MKQSELKQIIREEIAKLINEAPKPRITIDANLWNGRKPEREDSQYVIYSNDIYNNKFVNLDGRNPSNVFIVVQPSKQDPSKVWIKAGYGSESDTGEKRMIATIGGSVQVTPEELKSDPAGLAKSLAASMMKNKTYWNMNFQPYNDDAIFKIQPDVVKPALEVIKFAAKNIK